MWDSGWDDLFSRVEWGKYPCEGLIRFVARKFYGSKNRKVIKILEVGCGTGANLWFMAREGFTVDGLDGSQVALAKAKARFDREGLSVKLHHGDAMKLPFSDNVFDAVVDVECIYANSLLDSAQILTEAFRVLKPNGWLYSKTFATGMTGESSGIRSSDHEHTYTNMPDGPLRSDYGIIRLTAFEEIPRVYNKFSNLEVDSLIRTTNNRQYTVPEWIICGQKV